MIVPPDRVAENGRVTSGCGGQWEGARRTKMHIWRVAVWPCARRV